MFSVMDLPISPPTLFIGPKALPTPTGDGIYLIYLSDMYELSCSTEECQWKQKPQKLKTPMNNQNRILMPVIMYVNTDYHEQYCY